MTRVLIFAAAVLVVFSAIVTVSPILEGSIEAEPLVASISGTERSEPNPTIPSCIISTNPSNISRGEEASIAWGSENAVFASLSSVGEVPRKGGLYMRPLATSDYTLSVASPSGAWSYCTATVIVR